MPYLSLVTLAFNKDEEHDEALFKLVDPDCRISTIGGIKYIEYNWNIWYLESPCDSILAVMSYLEGLGRENYAFIRLGESVDDITYMGDTIRFGLAVDARVIIVPYHHKIKSKPTSGDINE